MRQRIMESCRDGIKPEDCARIWSFPLKVGDTFRVCCFRNIYIAMEDGGCKVIGDIYDYRKKKDTSHIKVMDMDENDFFYYLGELMFHSGRSIVKVQDYCDVNDVLCKIYRNGVVKVDNNNK